MNRTEHLLCLLAEEAAEVAHRVSKALRFGLDEIQEGQSQSNAERIIYEFADMLAIYELLEEHGAIGKLRDLRPPIDQKKQKVAKFLAYSETCGTVDEPVRRQRDDLLDAAETLLSRKRPGGKDDDPRLILEIDCINLEEIVSRVKGGAQ